MREKHDCDFIVTRNQILVPPPPLQVIASFIVSALAGAITNFFFSFPRTFLLFFWCYAIDPPDNFIRGIDTLLVLISLKEKQFPLLLIGQKHLRKVQWDNDNRFEDFISLFYWRVTTQVTRKEIKDLLAYIQLRLANIRNSFEFLPFSLLNYSILLYSLLLLFYTMEFNPIFPG